MVPAKVFIYYLDQLKKLLVKVERYEVDLSHERLSGDMFPLLQQARTAIGFTLRSSCPLSGRETVSFADGYESFASLFSEIDKTRQYLSEIQDAEFRHMDAIKIDTLAGFSDIELDGDSYFLMYSLPNFFFHYSMVYAIARKSGVPIGKGDFDGFHHYPLGFTFADKPEA